MIKRGPISNVLRCKRISSALYYKERRMWTMNFKAYLRLTRLHRPIGIWLLLFPSWWGLALARPQEVPFFALILFAFGAIFMRSAGCVYNDLVDKDLDQQVERTASRPLAAGEISRKEALVLLLFLLGGGALILFTFPPPVILTGFVALCLVFLYPWMKRVTYWPQVFLGVTLNLGILMGWFCFQPSLSLTPFPFYGGAILWTLGYDTIYALQDQKGDLLAGVKSSALVVSSFSKPFLAVIYGLTLALWGLGGLTAHLKGTYWFFLSLIGLHFIWQIFTLKEEVPNNCMKRFESNKDIGILLFLGIVFSHLID